MKVQSLFGRGFQFLMWFINPAYRVGIESICRQPRRPLLSGDNVNGSSVIRVPEWIETPLGTYYMYFGNHAGDRIHLAVADQLKEPWTVYEPGTLRLDDAEGFTGHIASPDVHVDAEEKRIRMYFHGKAKSRKGQWTGVAFSADGLNFTARKNYLGRFYFRVFEHDGWYYALAKDGNSGWGRLYRSRDGISEFERGSRILKGSRHTAVLKEGRKLLVFYSRVGDAPEQIFLSVIRLNRPWGHWKEEHRISVLKPKTPYEGAMFPVAPSTHDPAVMVRQLRDPCIYRQKDRVHLFYSIAGEMGLAKATLRVVRTGCLPRVVHEAVGRLLTGWCGRSEAVVDLYRLVLRNGLPRAVRQVCCCYLHPVIIAGCGRSGTTLLLSLLSCHPQIYTIDGEHSWFCPTAYRKTPDYNSPFKTDALLDYLVEKDLSGINTHWCEKTPKNVQYIGRILKHFGKGCRVIHMVRDGRDVITSRHPNKVDRYWVDTARWVEDVHAGLAFEDHPQVLMIRYEDLVEQCSAVGRALFEFIGIPYSSAIEQFPQGALAARLERVTMGHTVSEVHGDSVGRWKDPKHASVIQEFYRDPDAVELLTRLGYDADLDRAELNG